MKKVGILTFHAANNYGGCLQAYALQTVLCGLGAQAEIIRFQGEKLSQQPLAGRSLKARVMDGVIRTGATMVKFASAPGFNRFRARYFHYSQPVRRETAERLNDQYDLFLSGSDQVWNGNITGELEIYLQTFVREKKKKGSYAASFGIPTLPEDRKPVYRAALRDFQYLSVREPEGAEMISDLTGRKAEVVMDPTQLLSPDEWEKVMEPVGSNKPFILVYQLGPGLHLLERAQELSRHTGLRLVFVPFPEVKLLRGTYLPAISPAQWLYLMKHASYVVTNSFHGTAFSILFQKEFYTEVSPNLSALGSRITNLLNRYGLDDRLICEQPAAYEKTINYARVMPLVEQDREMSLRYLRNVLKE